jgi:predicted short-subunit dehydrogenase-like oxidoreductase (DUF2520 family)
MTTLNLIGAGRVGCTLGTLWGRNGVFEIQDVLTTHSETAQAACTAMGAGRPVNSMHDMRPAEVWMVAVPDADIDGVATELAEAIGRKTPAQPPVVFHCSGAQDASRLHRLSELGWHTASAHCILSFTQPMVALEQFAGTACALEGEPRACTELEAAFARIGAHCFRLKPEDKVLYHAAAVFATNFLPVLQSVAEAAWLKCGVPPELLTSLRANLLRFSVDNITRLGPAGALTGPAARGDVRAIATQAEIVRAWDPSSADAYSALSALALRLAGHDARVP